MPQSLPCYDCPVEATVAQALDDLGIEYAREGSASKAKGDLDFTLPSLGISIECKAAWSPRLEEQIRGRRDVIVVQGLAAARGFAALLAAGNRYPKPQE